MNPTFASSARRSFGLGSLALLFALAACGGEDANTTAREASAGVAETPGTSADRLELTISNGPFAGTHQVAHNFDCAAQPGSLFMTLDREGNQGITQSSLILQGVPVTGGSTSQVQLVVAFADMADAAGSSMVALSTMAGAGAEAGSATGTTRREGRGAVIEVEGTNHDGVELAAVIRCETLDGIGL